MKFKKNLKFKKEFKRRAKGMILSLSSLFCFFGFFSIESFYFITSCTNFSSYLLSLALKTSKNLTLTN